MDRVVDPIDGDEHSIVTFRIDCINPGFPVLLNDFLILTGPTRHAHESDFKTADEAAVRMRYQVTGAWGLSVSVSARDMLASHRELRIWSLRPDDPLLHDMEEVDGAYARLTAKPSAAYKAERALVVAAGDLHEFPVGLPDGRKIMCANLSRAITHKGTYFPDIGFLPLHRQRR